MSSLPPAPPPLGAAAAHIGDRWRRLHPLSPVVRFGRLLAALLVITVPSLQATRSQRGEQIVAPIVVWGALILIGAIAGVISWAVTRWRIDGSDLRIETGLIRRQSFRIPLSRIQAVDIVAPLIGRLLGLAEVRVISAGRGSEKGRLAYLTAAEAPLVRARLLALAHGLAGETPEPPAVPLLRVNNAQLVVALALRAQVAVPMLVIVGAVTTILLAPAVGVALVSSSLTVVIGSAVAVARVFNEDFDFSISEAGDGVRLDRGLLQRRHETIPFGRIQAVRLVQPLLWRPFGWWRLEVDVARQHTPRQADQEGQRVARTLIPVTHRDPALWLAARVFPGASVEPPPGSRPPRRAMFKAPLSYHFLAAWSSDRYAYARTGRVQAATVVAPLDKMQSVRFTQGPVQRALRLASTHVDTAGQRWQASAHCREESEAEAMLWRLGERARQARRLHRTRPSGVAVATSG